MSRSYILNLETQKIELHFENTEYEALAPEQKKELSAFFLWSPIAEAWVSKAKEPNLWRSKQIAEKLGFSKEERQGKRLSFAEQVEVKSEKAEARAERLEQYSSNAADRGEALQRAFNARREDIAFLTQPITAGAGGRAFANEKARIMNRYNKGFEEYRKSAYFAERAAAARKTADMRQLKNKSYLERHIHEQEKTLSKLKGNLSRYEFVWEMMKKGEPITGFYGGCTAEQIETWCFETLERMEMEIAKLAFYQNCLSESGGIQYGKDNIKPGYTVKIRGCVHQIVKTNPKTVEVKSPVGSGMTLAYSYAEIDEVVKAQEKSPREKTAGHPYQEGDILARYNVAGSSLIDAFQVIKRTDKTIEVQKLLLDENRKPRPGVFAPGSRPERKKPYISRFNGEWNVADDGWTLSRYNE